VQPVPLKPNGARIKFRTIKTNTVVAVTYNAVCRAVGPGLIGFVAVSITGDGVELGPGGDDFPMCSPPKDGLTIMYAANSRQIAVRVPNPGEHTVQVLTVLGSTATAGDLSAHSIIIQD
jgi:hypothetical protein